MIIEKESWISLPENVLYKTFSSDLWINEVVKNNKNNGEDNKKYFDAEVTGYRYFVGFLLLFSYTTLLLY